MSIPTLLPVRGTVASGPKPLVCAPNKLGWKPQVARIPSLRLHRGAKITACAAPCEVSAPIGEKVGFNGVALEASVLQCVKEGLVFHEGRSPDVIRAAAYLRALSFYTYPEGRTEEALKLHRKMKTDDEFTALTSKVAGLEQGYKRIVCILALYPLSCLEDRSIVELHPALKVTLSGEEHVLVGSLDLNQGRILPGEISGTKPEVGSPFLARTPESSLRLSAPSRKIQGLSADRERGYLSNVCVAPLMRQRGVGVALLQQAQKIAQLWGITSLYVHVVATNEAAVKLYNKGGFIFEREESASDARRQSRPRRSLLHKFI